VTAPQIDYAWSNFAGNSALAMFGGGAGGGVLVQYVTSRMHNCGLYGNESYDAGGGVAAYRAQLEMVNTALSCNSANDIGGGIALLDLAAGLVVNSTLSRNKTREPTASRGGGIYAGGLDAQVYNTVFFENVDASGDTYTAQLYHHAGTLVSEHDCFTPAACPPVIGTNICANPMLIDPDGADGACGTMDDDVRIAAASMCVDRGADSRVPADLLDIDGSSTVFEPVPLDLDATDRFVGTVDIGAYEVDGGASCPADLDGDGDLTIFDFFEFQNLFAMMDPRADFTGDGKFDIFDFLQFQNEFAAGCP
jgi:hypothetical protein